MLKRFFCAIIALLIASAASAGGIELKSSENIAYIGVGGAYNQLVFPRTTVQTDLVLADDGAGGVNIFGGLNKVRTTSTNYSLTAFMGYLFAVSRSIHIGPELGYANYGHLIFENVLVVQAETGSIRVNMSGVTAFLVARYTSQHLFFVEGKVGTVYMNGLATSNYALVNGTSDPFTSKQVASSQKFLYAVGADFGFYLVPYISLGFYYQHIFGRLYNNFDFAQTGNYVVRTKFFTPTMNIYGVALSFYFR